MIEIKAINQAEKELKYKLDLEKTFRPEVISLFNFIVKEFRVIVANTGLPPRAVNYKSAIMQLLKKHYTRVYNKFKNIVSSGNNIKIPTELMDEIEFLFLQWADDHSDRSSKFITETNAKNMQSAIEKARLINTQEKLPLDNRTIAATSAGILSNYFKGRYEKIIVFETQAPAERTKLIEAYSIVKKIDDIIKSIKRWITIGDKFVRTTHNKVNGQKKDVDKPFIVGGFFLRHPGDSLLGAPIKETANCRCAAYYQLLKRG